RPFQVNPPTQFLNTPGGTAPVRELPLEGRRLRVNADRVVESITLPSGFGAVTFDQGDIVDYLRRGRLPGARKVRDSFEAASGALAFELDLPPRGRREVNLLIPLASAPPQPAPQASPPRASRTGAARAGTAHAGAARGAASGGAGPASATSGSAAPGGAAPGGAARTARFVEAVRAA